MKPVHVAATDLSASVPQPIPTRAKSPSSDLDTSDSPDAEVAYKHLEPTHNCHRASGNNHHAKPRSDVAPEREESPRPEVQGVPFEAGTGEPVHEP